MKKKETFSEAFRICAWHKKNFPKSLKRNEVLLYDTGNLGWENILVVPKSVLPERMSHGICKKCNRLMKKEVESMKPLGALRGLGYA